MRKSIITLLILVTSLACSYSWAKGVYQSPEDFILEIFSSTAPEAERVIVKGDLSKELKSILGHRYSKIRIPYWRDGDRTVWILEKIGKELPITAGFVISDNQVEQFKVLVFRESRGWEIRNDFFTEQFDGAYLTTKNKLNQPIDNITGATMSVNAMKKLSRMALYLHKQVVKEE
ncbi:MAG: FMN-binding protein [Gammaproteobacteria bacterium]|nr:FMN-binding protein [Gammaproteobacteria bacterium]